MHTIPPSVLEEMLANRAVRFGNHVMRMAPDWNFSFYEVPTKRLLERLVEMFEQPGFECGDIRVSWAEGEQEVADLNEARDALASRGNTGELFFAISSEGQTIFERSSSLGYDEEAGEVELVFFEHRLDLIARPGLWHAMVEYACHAARVAGARGVLIHDGSAWEADMGSMIDGDDPEHPDRAIWVDR